MDLIKCPRCGEEFSPSYRKCPFCEEGDHPRRVKYNSGKSGRRVSDKKQTHSARGAMAGVLVVVLLLLSWSLFGDKLVAKINADKTPGTEQTDGQTPDDGAAADPSGTDADPNGANGDTTVPPDADTDPNGGDAPDPNAQPQPGDTTTPDTTTPDTTAPTVDASSLSIRTNVGTTLSRDASGSFDCTIKKSESIKLTVSGTDAAAAWSVADASVLTISADGGITPLKTGTTNVTASVGGAVLTIIVRVVN